MKTIQDNYTNSKDLNWKPSKLVGFSSKQLSLLNNCSFKLIKIEPHAMYPTHSHPNKTETLLIISGTLAITIGDIRYQGITHDFFVFPSGARHSIMNLTNKECLVYVTSIKNEN
ncbi:cupin domain-containing protein [Oceanihabitans sediminis]|uniref:cupin domain-containing protein n=1 Tax=Oceanihabitans sediminis TaxID=1812012 RepID=UPI00299F493E|nr:cupin domain-containing protein [Oceanihabitans sediminis]MDX1279230.1 cupin domain-containing protein [Oceanihabitans sediminis]